MQVHEYDGSQTEEMSVFLNCRLIDFFLEVERLRLGFKRN